MEKTHAVEASKRALVALSIIAWIAGCSSGGGAKNPGSGGHGGSAGNGTGGNGTAGNGTAGNGTAGNGTAGAAGDNGTAGMGGNGGNATAGAGGNGGNATAGAGGNGGNATAGAGGNGGNATAGAGGNAGADAAAGAGGSAGADAAAGSAGHDAGVDVATDASHDEGSDTGSDAGTDVAPCGADGMACEAAGGVAGTCLNHVCKVCVDTTDDAKCAAAYTAGHICVAGKCVAGDCHNSTGCATGLVCGATVANKCGACASDTQCQTDTHYGANTICDTTTGHANSGKCVSSMCNALGTCAANAADTCCTMKCVTGNCCSDDDCHTNTMFGPTYFCSANHLCSKCAAATGNQYFVDPVNGDDATATGSGKTNVANLPSCSFRTVTRALQVIGATPAAGTVITIVGTNGATTPLYVTKAAATDPAPEILPIPVPANVKIATSGGPISVVLKAAGSGFTLAGDGAGIAAVTAAPLTIDGNAHASGVGILVAPGAGKTASLANVNVKNTGDDGISVTSGNVAIGAGVTVTSAGVAGARASGLNVTNGVVTITVPAGQTASTFNGNSLHGIEVTLLGVVNATGVPVTDPAITGAGTVVASGNSRSNVFISQTPGMAPSVGVLDGVVGWNSTTASGLEITAGSSVKVRNSVFINNTTDGVLITSADTTAAGNALGAIDLGVAAGFGKNILQVSATAVANHANPGAGICVQLGMNGGTQNLAAAGNTFAGPLDCSKPTPGGGINRTATCANHVDEAIVPATGTTVTITTTNCL
jgi:hypothetical protein